MSFIKKQLEKCGVEPHDIGAVLMTYKILGTTTFFGGWLVCHRFKPLASLGRTQYVATLKKNYPNISKRISVGREKIEKRLYDSNLFGKFSKLISTNKRGLIGSLLEIILIKKLGSPIIFPLELYTAWGIVKWIKFERKG